MKNIVLCFGWFHWSINILFFCCCQRKQALGLFGMPSFSWFHRTHLSTQFRSLLSFKNNIFSCGSLILCIFLGRFFCLSFSMEQHEGTGLCLLIYITYLNTMLLRYEPRPEGTQHGRTLWEKYNMMVLLTREESQIHGCGSAGYCFILVWLSGDRLQSPHTSETSLTNTYAEMLCSEIFESTGLLAFLTQTQIFKKIHENTCFPQYLLKKVW